ncbi:MAG: C25 family peptidase propeptide domain-containing protein, partial [candidate division WOR-3 bacterium]
MLTLVFATLISALNFQTLGDKGIQITFTGYEIDAESRIFSGATSFAKSGEPDIPSLSLIIGIPQNGNVDVRVVENQVEKLSNIDIPPVTPLAIYEAPFPEEREPLSEIYSQDQYYPAQIVGVSEPGYFRDINVVSLRLNPIRYNPVKKELLISRVLKIMVNFTGTPRVAPSVDNSFESIYQHTIMNYEQCKNWRREIQQQSIKNPFSTGAWFKIEVGQEGIYRITYDELKRASIDPRQFDPKTLKIYNAAFDLLPKNVLQEFPDSLTEIPIYVEGEDDHNFDKQDYIVFYGFPASHFIYDTTLEWFENGYALKNVYWLTFGGSYGKRMERIDATWNNSNPDTIITEILHLEQDLYNPTRSGINWYWQDMSLGEAESTMVRLPVTHQFSLGEATFVTSIFVSMSPNPQPFWVRFGLNGNIFYDDTTVLPQAMSLPAVRLTGNGTLIGDTSTFEFQIRRPQGTNAKLTMYLNCLDLEYQRMTDLTYPFHAYLKIPGDYTIKCKKADSRVFILDITNIRFPKMFDNFKVAGKTVVFSNHCDSPK